MNEIHLPKTKVAELHAICAERNNDPGELINILHAAQGLFGYLPCLLYTSPSPRDA